jgi:lysophospholipase L1-like esterase
MRPVRVRLVLLFAVVALLVIGPAASAGAQPENGYQETFSPRYYLSLGDSVAAGWQPDEAGVGHYTRQGYTDVLFRRLQEEIPGLRHMKLGCPGETTASMLTGVGSSCTYPRGSQLAQARDFLLKHPGEVALITITIGVNDVLACPLEDPNVMECLQGKFAQIGANLPQILDPLKKMTGGQVPIIGMNYYNPFLAYWLDEIGGDTGDQLAEQLNSLLMLFNNQVLAPIYGSFGIPVADVFTAFRTARWAMVDDTPVNVARICRLTWMCVGEPQGPDIHPNLFGHRVIANAFQRVLAGL